MANRFTIRRTSVAGRAANSTYINAGELGLNMADQILYSMDASNTVFIIGANVVNESVSNSLMVGNVGSISPASASIVVGNTTTSSTINATAIVIGNATVNTFVVNTYISGNGFGLTSITASAAPGGSNTQVQFNDSATTAGDANLTWNKTTSTLTATNLVGNGSGITSVNAAFLDGVAAASYINVAGNYTITGNHTYGNSTVFVYINSSSVGAGTINSTAVGFLATNSSLKIGNSSVNTSINSSSITTGSFIGNGASLTSVMAASNLVATGTATGAIPLSVVGAASATANLFQVSNSGSVQFAINSLGCGVYGTAGSLTIGTINATSVGASFTNSTIMVGNSSLNAVINSTSIHVDGLIIANGNSLTTLNAAALTAGDCMICNSSGVYNDLSTKSFDILAPVAGDTYTVFWTKTALTLAEISVVLQGASAWANLGFFYGTDRSTATSANAAANCSNVTVGTRITSFAATAIPANGFFWCNVGGMSGATEIHATIRVT